MPLSSVQECHFHCASFSFFGRSDPALFFDFDRRSIAMLLVSLAVALSFATLARDSFKASLPPFPALPLFQAVFHYFIKSSLF